MRPAYEGGQFAPKVSCRFGDFEHHTAFALLHLIILLGFCLLHARQRASRLQCGLVCGGSALHVAVHLLLGEVERNVVFQESLPLQGAELAPHAIIVVVVMIILVTCAEERAGCRATRGRCGEAAGLALARRRLCYFEESAIRIHTERRLCHDEYAVR